MSSLIERSNAFKQKYQTFDLTNPNEKKQSSLGEYEGGGTWFRRQKKLIKNNIGYATLHPGNITHKHGARAVTKGTRYIIVSFMENGER